MPETTYRDGKAYCGTCKEPLTPAQIGGDDAVWDGPRFSGYHPHNHEECETCAGTGLSGSHDCGEDTCCCLEPEENVPCHMCDGKGYY